MSSHREAPAISKDAAADNTDVYAFVDPHNADHVILIANFNPFELPYGGPNFAEFADDVVYSINIAKLGTSKRDLSFQFRFNTKIRNTKTFLYNTGPIGKAPAYANWTRPQTYSVTRVTRKKGTADYTHKVLAEGLGVPPVNVGARSTPDYDAMYTQDAIHKIGSGIQVFAGQRADAFRVDLGSIFDLGGVRTLNELHELRLANMPGVNGLSGLNVHSIAMSVPITLLSRNGDLPTNVDSPASCIGVWASASRARSRTFDSKSGTYKSAGAQVQVSRLGNPLFNEVINPMSEKDKWNSVQPYDDSAFAKYVTKPELGNLLPGLYPDQFPNLDQFNKSGKPRLDLEAILLTGLPSGIIDGLSTATGGPLADMLRLNLAVKPTQFKSSSFSKFGVLGNDLAGFPNGRRVGDDVTAIELRAIAGATIRLIPAYKTYVPDAPVLVLTDDSENTYYDNPKVPDGADFESYMPFLPVPNSGYATTALIGSTGGPSGTDGAPENGT